MYTSAYTCVREHVPEKVEPLTVLSLVEVRRQVPNCGPVRPAVESQGCILRGEPELWRSRSEQGVLLGRETAEDHEFIYG